MSKTTTVYAIKTKEKDHWVFHEEELKDFVVGVESVYACWEERQSMTCMHLYSYPIFNHAFESLPQDDQNGIWDVATMSLANMDDSLSHQRDIQQVRRMASKQNAPQIDTECVYDVVSLWLNNRPL